MNPVYVASVGMTRFGVLEEGLLGLLEEAGRSALVAGGDQRPEAIFVGAAQPEALGGVPDLAGSLVDGLDLSGTPAMRIDTASSSGAAVVVVAFAAIASGQYRRVLVLAGEKMTGRPNREVTRILAQVLHESERSLGLTMPAMAALFARAYMRRRGMSERHLKDLLALLALQAHANGALNPLAHFQRPVSMEEYRNARPVAEPLSVFDCAPISDGAAAIVLSAEPTDVRIAGLGQGADSVALGARATLGGLVATSRAAAQAYQMASFGPESVDFAEVHDAFTIFGLLALQDLGLIEEADVPKAIKSGWTALHGRLPINPSGGLKARGHPVGASGLAQIVEAVQQMRGLVGPARQVGHPARALTHSMGGPGSNNFVVLLERTDADRASMTVPEMAGPGVLHEIDVRAETASLLAHDHRGAVAPPSKQDVLETYTVVHVPPEGFAAPLTLGLVTLSNGNRLLAVSDGSQPPRLGGHVTVSTEDSHTAFQMVPRTVARVDVDKVLRRVNSAAGSLQAAAISVKTALSLGRRFGPRRP